MAGLNDLRNGWWSLLFAKIFLHHFWSRQFSVLIEQRLVLSWCLRVGYIKLWWIFMSVPTLWWNFSLRHGPSKKFGMMVLFDQQWGRKWWEWNLQCLFNQRSEMVAKGPRKRNGGWWKLSRSGMEKVVGVSCGLKILYGKLIDVDGRRLVTPIFILYSFESPEGSILVRTILICRPLWLPSASIGLHLAAF